MRNGRITLDGLDEFYGPPSHSTCVREPQAFLASTGGGCLPFKGYQEQKKMLRSMRELEGYAIRANARTIAHGKSDWTARELPVSITTEHG